MRAVSEIVAFLILLGALTVAFISVLVIVPKYFDVYNRLALQAGYTHHLQGFQTSASLTRVALPDQYVLTVIIVNTGSNYVKVSYSVSCEGEGGTYYVGGGYAVINPNSIHQKTFYVTKTKIRNKVCYLMVEEPRLLIYKVVEA